MLPSIFKAKDDYVEAPILQFCSYIYLSLLQVIDFVNVIYSRLSFICLLLINHSDLSLTAVPLYLRQPWL